MEKYDREHRESTNAVDVRIVRAVNNLGGVVGIGHALHGRNSLQWGRGHCLFAAPIRRRAALRPLLNAAPCVGPNSCFHDYPIHALVEVE